MSHRSHPTESTRRTFVVGAAATVAAPLMIQSGARAQAGRQPIALHALLVGINTYRGQVKTPVAATGQTRLSRIPALRGCLNDVAMIEAAVRPIAAQTRVLKEAAATRSAFLAAWRETLQGAARGDTILLTFSGHGHLEIERAGDNKPTGHNPVFMFSGYDAAQPGPPDRIVSYEIGALFEEARAKAVRVVFVGDCCHSGTLTRSLDERDNGGLSYRSPHKYDVSAELGGSVAASTRLPQKELPNVLYFAGCQDDEKVPEIKLPNGTPHGAMSVAFARALGGLATTQRDGAMTGGVLQSFVQSQVRILSDSLQHPNVVWPTHDIRSGLRPDDVLFYTRSVGQSAPVETGASRAPVSVRILNMSTAEATATVGALQGVRPVTDDADLTYDAADGAALNRGTRIASGVKPTELQAVVERVRALPILVQLASAGGISMRIVRGGHTGTGPDRAADAVHAFGTPLVWEVTGLRVPYLVIVNLSGDGTVQFLYPSAKHDDPPQVPIDRPYTAPVFRVQPPAGSDHVVVIASQARADDLIAELTRIDRTRSIDLAMVAIEAAARRPQTQIGFQGIYTGDK